MSRLTESKVGGCGASAQKSLFIPLKTEFFEAFKRGEKYIEFRRYGSRWNEITCRVGRSVVLSKGYGKSSRLRGRISAFEKRYMTDDNIDWISCYGKPDFAACIHIQIKR